MPSGRLLRQVLSAIGRRPVAWVTAVLLAALGLGALGLAAISFWSLRPYVARAAIGPEASVLLAAHAPAAETEALRNSLEQLGTVASARFLSRDAALADLAARTPSDREAIDQLAVNPLPDAIVVTFRPWAAPDAIESTAAAIRKMPRVDAVELDVGWYRKVRALLRLVVPGAGFLGAAFLVHAVGWMLVAVTLSAPIDSGRVQLLWLLGADDRMIRRTPVAAGALTALVAAAVALLVTRAGCGIDRPAVCRPGPAAVACAQLGGRLPGRGDVGWCPDRIGPGQGPAAGDPDRGRRLERILNVCTHSLQYAYRRGVLSSIAEVNRIAARGSK